MQSIYVLYDVDQVVTFGVKSVDEECGFCGGVGTITGMDKTSSTCPVCYGRGHRTIKTEQRGVILSYRVEGVCNQRNTINTNIIYEIKEYGSNKIHEVNQDDIVYTAITEYIS